MSWLGLMVLAGCGNTHPVQSPHGLDLALWAPPERESEPLNEWDGSEQFIFTATLDAIEQRGGVEGMTLGWGDGTYTVLTLLDAQDAQWEIGLSLDEAVGDEVLELDVQPGAELDVQFIHGVGFADDHAILIHDSAGLVFIGEEGWHTDLDQMEPDPSGDLNVEVGDAGGPKGRGDCGRVRGVSLEVQADETVEVPFDGQEPVTVDGVAAMAHNLGAYTYVGQVGCTDTWGPWSWAIVR